MKTHEDVDRGQVGRRGFLEERSTPRTRLPARGLPVFPEAEGLTSRKGAPK